MTGANRGGRAARQVETRADYTALAAANPAAFLMFLHNNIYALNALSPLSWAEDKCIFTHTHTHTHMCGTPRHALSHSALSFMSAAAEA